MGIMQTSGTVALVTKPEESINLLEILGAKEQARRIG